MYKSKASSSSRREFIKSTTAIGLAGMATFITPAQAQERAGQTTSSKPLEIVIYLYDGMTALGAIGTYEVLRCMSNSTVKFAARQRGAVKMDSRVLTINADYAIEEIKSADILVLPGGATTLAQMADKAVLEAHEHEGRIQQEENQQGGYSRHYRGGHHQVPAGRVFAEETGQRASIGSLEEIEKIVNGDAGTIVETA